MISEEGAKIGGLQEPTKKMSKTDEGDNGVVYFEDTPEQVVKKLRRAVTDSENIKSNRLQTVISRIVFFTIISPLKCVV